MNQQGKIWGRTAKLFSRNNVEVHRIEAVPGGYCSQHRHAQKWNLFFVESGTLEITIWQAEGRMDVTRLNAGECCSVPPGLYHRFEAVTDVVALEVYWTELSGNDIDRSDTGGIRQHPANT